MRSIGIDVSKHTLAVYISESEQFEVPNTEQGFQTLHTHLRQDDLVGVESTSTYHHHAAFFLLSQGITVKELNPIMTKQFIRATVRKKKTDKSDAEVIARLVAQGEGHDMTQKQLQNTLKRLWRSKQKLIKMRTSLKLQMGVLAVSLTDVKDLKKTYQRLIRSFDKEIEQLGEIIERLDSEDIRILDSIPGISPQLARGLCAEIGDISRFSNKKQLVAFGGLDPKLSESGISLHARGRLTKRGSPYIRMALYRAAFASITRENQFGRYYRKKREEKKHHTVAMCATARKILEVAFTTLTKQQVFQV